MPHTFTPSIAVRRGDVGPAVAAVRELLESRSRLPAVARESRPVFDAGLDRAVRAFQQDRGLTADGVVDAQTWRELEAARWRPGDRILSWSVSHPYAGDDVVFLQRRLMDLGFDAGRVDGVFSSRTDRALRQFQREFGLIGDGTCGPLTMRAFSRLERAHTGGRPHELRESELLRRRGPTLAGKVVVLDPGHGGRDAGWVVGGLAERDVVEDLAARVEGRLLACGASAYQTHGRDRSPSESERAELANELRADLLVSLHCDGAPSASCEGMATYYYGSGRDSGSRAGERLAELLQREVVRRTQLLDARSHAKTWDLLRLTRMPAVRIELGYLTSRHDRALLAAPDTLDQVASGLLAGIQRLFLPEELDPPTGELVLPQHEAERVPA